MSLLRVGIAGRDRPLFPCFRGDLLLLQEISSKRARKPLIRAGFAPAGSKICSKQKSSKHFAG
ncbi:MAG: hypothetical protein AB7H71_01850 [Alphaproteobacteria bacterium]